MKTASPALAALGRLYAESKAGRTGAGQRDFLVDFKKLLTEARCSDGDERASAENDLRRLDGSLIALDKHPRDPNIIEQVRLPLEKEAAFFELLGADSPTRHRRTLAAQFADAARLNVPLEWTVAWRDYCAALENAALNGEAIAPFSRDDRAGNHELLHLVPRLLDWRAQGGDSLIRFASCVLTGKSKRLEELAARNDQRRQTGKLGAILEQLSGGKLSCLEDVGIWPAPRSVLAHGPLRLNLGGQWLDTSGCQGPFRLSETDILGATTVETDAARCVTVENETSFHELAKLQCGDLLVCSSYPGSATRALLRRIPDALDWWHFGDSDPEGFDILRDLRERSQRPFQALHMRWRLSPGAPPLTPAGRRLLQRLCQSETMRQERPVLERILSEGNLGAFEQESLGKPTTRGWPFYSEA